MNKILNSTIVLLGIATICFLLFTKRKKSKYNKGCQILCMSNDDDLKKVKNIQLTQCKTCESYCESKTNSNCCANCQQTSIISDHSHHRNEHCLPHHHHHHLSHHRHHHLSNNQVNINLLWLAIPLIVFLTVGIFWKNMWGKNN